MSNNWGYSSLGQRDRLDLIRKGNDEVYNAEKIKNSSLKNLRVYLGLPTEEIDEWERTIDNAWEKSKSSSKAALPKFLSTRADKVTNAYNNYLKELRSEIEKQASEAVESAIKDSRYLAEYLANHGFSKDGTTRKQVEKNIDQELSQELESIRKYFDTQSTNARSKYLAQLKQ